MSKEWWLCGQIREATRIRNRSIWDLVGVFDSEEKAIKACRNETYFIYPIELNKQYPDEEVVPKGAYYPLG